ncbi:hypothetical protein SAMN02745123_02977 [Desulforamulus aeronauticus DSM 10349]|uniref:Uncharacterized protein n=1 Tax=Desulforamulus aeronauticus DSM 10349 TaxID=1121421 RepID=A0A1M6UY35_9FIRM|nr:hypothetical protein SAMN02745123_02977 [Desulforamulus aeronauticus DSM 10349]
MPLYLLFEVTYGIVESIIKNRRYKKMCKNKLILNNHKLNLEVQEEAHLYC